MKLKHFVIIALGMIFSAPPLWADGGAEFFRDNIFPVLDAHCFECHGKGEKLKADLRLTSREGLLHGGEQGTAFNEKDPAKSLLLDMISYRDVHHEMPPKRKLPDATRELLATWLNQGAPYDPELEIHGEAEEKKTFTISDRDRDYWAYRPFSHHAPPVPKDERFRQHPIDAFLQARREQNGTEASPPVDPETLLRRASYNLTGLPPSHAEVEAFLKNHGPAAWKAKIEELLSRPQYGEHWARHWLDLVRYADTNGFERDNNKPEVWKYRDYVVRAFNEDKPYNRFVLEQLAGDELDEVTRDSLIATGYHRLMQWDDEPADRIQYPFDILADNVTTTAEVFLGSTLGCARCHDHKADPFSTRDFYQFMAFFNGIDKNMRGDGSLRNFVDPNQRAKLKKQSEEEIARLTQENQEIFKEAQTLLAEETGQNKNTDAVQTLLATSQTEPQHWKVWPPNTPPPNDWFEVGFDDTSWPEQPGGFGTPKTPGSVVGTVWSSGDIWLRRHFRLTEIPADLYLMAHHDEKITVYLNGVNILEEPNYLVEYQLYHVMDKARTALQTGKNVLAIHCQNGGGGQYVDAGLYSGKPMTMPPEVREYLAHSKDAIKVLGRDKVNTYRKNLKAIDRLNEDADGEKIFGVSEGSGEIPQMFVHIRGSVYAPGDPVEPQMPTVLLPKDAPLLQIPEAYKKQGTSGRRRALAEWIVQPENALTARVIVNRVWQFHFGKGLQGSPNDFGQLGETPTHPELLDWLAEDFVRSGWSIKHLQQLIMTSQAYQMSSAPMESNFAADPTNQSYWRFDMRRLAAEEIRDSILLLTNTLNLESGGPPVFPPVAQAVLETSSKPNSVWGKSPPDQANRRSLYAKIKRSLQIPIMADFDQATTDVSCPSRFTTTVPTQALNMMNGEFINGQAKLLGERLRKEAPDLDAQIQAVYQMAFARSPEAWEAKEVHSLIERLMERFTLDEAAALDRFCLVFLNLNEFIYLD